MNYKRCGNSGLKLSNISLGLWHNFGGVDDFENAKTLLFHAFGCGITHFDLANNYGPPPGSAESNFGKVLAKEFKSHRDEIIVSSKAGHLMWNGPYGDGGSRKSIMASIDQSLKRTGLEYFDVFYSHRYDAETPLEETIQALIDIVKQGKALYIGLSKYPADLAEKAYKMMLEQHVKCLVYQDRYSLLTREVEKEHVEMNTRNGVGFVSFSPLAQGLLTDRYLNGIPEDSRAAKSHGFLQKDAITPELIAKVQKLNSLAQTRGQSLAQMALAWQINKEYVSSVIVGASTIMQLQDNIDTLSNTNFSVKELKAIDSILR